MRGGTRFNPVQRDLAVNDGPLNVFQLKRRVERLACGPEAKAIPYPGV